MNKHICLLWLFCLIVGGCTTVTKTVYVQAELPVPVAPALQTITPTDWGGAQCQNFPALKELYRKVALRDAQRKAYADERIAIIRSQKK